MVNQSSTRYTFIRTLSLLAKLFPQQLPIRSKLLKLAYFYPCLVLLLIRCFMYLYVQFMMQYSSQCRRSVVWSRFLSLTFICIIYDLRIFYVRFHASRFMSLAKLLFSFQLSNAFSLSLRWGSFVFMCRIQTWYLFILYSYLLPSSFDIY